MRDDLTEIIMVVDQSGSMEPLRTDAIGGFNAFLADQKKQPGHANLTLVLFNTEYRVVVDGQPIQDVPPLNIDTYVPGGMTALLDAMGKAINQTGTRLATIPEPDRPGKVILVVLTDGQENSSHEFSKAKIAEMVQHQEEKYGWKVIFLSSDLNAIRDASRGANAYVRLGCCAGFAADKAGTRAAYDQASDAVSSYRITGNTGDLADPLPSDKVDKN